MLLILTSRGDLASDYLILRLRERSIPFVRFNSEDFPDRAEVSLEMEPNGWSWRLKLCDREYRAADFSAVYLRHLRLGAVSGIAPVDTGFAEQEVAETLRSFWRIIPDELWLNHPRDVWLSSNKVLQLATASALGLDVPRSLVTNSRDRIKHFAKSAPANGMVAKAVKHGFAEIEGRTVLAGTQPFSLEDLQSLEVAERVPMLIQDRPTKKSDVRVVVVRDDVFAVRIHSDVSPRAEPDWRIQQLKGRELVHEVFRLPPEIESLCRKLPGCFGLKYSSMDFIEDLDGRFLFLELNPNGQWAWIEQVTGCPIRDSLIQALGF